MIRKWGRVSFAALLLCFLNAALAQTEKLGVSAALEKDANGSARVRVTFNIPDEHYVYSESTHIDGVRGTQLVPVELPEAKRKYDSFFEKELSIYAHSVEFLYGISAYSNHVAHVEVAYQGCNAEICFLPERQTFDLKMGEDRATPTMASTPPQATIENGLVDGDYSWTRLAHRFESRGNVVGYLSSEKLLAFLAQAKSGVVDDASGLGRVLATRGMFITLLLTMLLGLGLNLTPCVLPMIPINIAIIGAGAQAGSRARGFALGGAYGLGITIVYGLLGVIVVYTRSKFGQLNASPWFNFGIGLLFVVLALAMFDLLRIDFSRFTSGKAGGSRGKRGGFIAALLIGGLSALLAGACVAPALISVLVLSSDLYAKGNNAGLLLPFLLGLGMALPWPFAGAGLSFLPKPGKWMERVKQVFGVIMILFAAFYIWTGVKIIRPAQHGIVEGWHTSLAPALAEAAQSGKPVFIDFWATWCKSCLKMEKTTFKNTQVKAALDDYVKVKLQAENPSAPETKAMLDYFGAVGMPTYVVLQPPERER
ncbi:MAG: protein-disulfide reductase DsbD family protein [Verrucomicrobia bacterium]|nr:protein-disulfide reductase DsbD family protein [Verrucomicrobiota bacterium]